MLTVDIALPEVEELQKLVTQGQEKGFLTYDEIVSGLDDVELTKEQIEDFYTYLIDHSIELVEGEQYKSPPHEQPALAEEDTKPAPTLDLTVEPSLDSLRLYLREIGKVPLLTADQEVYLAKRIERGDMSAKTQMVVCETAETSFAKSPEMPKLPKLLKLFQHFSIIYYMIYL
jgi:RNA polymerase primary sigma factor